MSGTDGSGTTTEHPAPPAAGPGGAQPPTPPPAEPTRPAPRRRRAPTPGDMIRSLLVLLVPVLIITWIFTRTPDQPQVPTVNWQPVYTTAQKAAPYRLLVPSELPSGWRATRVQWTPSGTSDDAGNLSAGNAWTLGFLSPDTIYFAIRQTDGPAPPFIAHLTRDGVQDGTSTVHGQTWTRYVSEDGRTRALVHRTGKVTSIVVADAPYAALESFADHLHD